ncbi:MAG: FAD-dependent oxidoreductase [Deltaproteobacteria bacterium]|nr:FAD-dependent oxidoreductase [Deltaproteobacteria bacterium]
MTRQIAIVGAGVTGLVCAQSLQKYGASVTVFDKGRAVGGRLSTRRIDPHTLDLGAQYFTARDPRFVTQVRRWSEAHVCAPWPGRIVALDADAPRVRDTEPQVRWVGTPDMSSVARALASEITVKNSHRVDAIVRDGAHLVLYGVAGPSRSTLAAASSEAPEVLGRFDMVLVCLPSDQASRLLGTLSHALSRAVSTVSMEPCFALGFVPHERHHDALGALDFDGVFVGSAAAPHASALSWAARDSSKPSRPPGDRWVLHATAAWTRDHFAMPEPEIARAMLDDFASLFALESLEATVQCVRRWTFARAHNPRDEGAYFDHVAQVGVGGDWACGGRVEGAYLSGLSLAELARASLAK